ncbi:uncharacterized protein EDB91DRAFT_1086214 [Suillus paluster]|uniref:uncharacterized protein n=1 Tax=Suillus paluster TaxID=48578 RepID=UPI001B867572|nr:uncharacterized protein EDB91DRAFT_1086214 [Suillus paluster]KAG1728049.1 hypothetical protein EDB91DRAFT_1086214 [Suillus paluster]
MSLLNNMPDSKQQGSDDDGNVDDYVDFDDDDNHDIPADLLAMIKYHGHSCPITNYFEIAKTLQHREMGMVPVPLCSFIIEHTAFHLAYDPSIRNISVDDAAIKFGLPDLQPAIANFLHCEATHRRDHIYTIGGTRRARPTTPLPFDNYKSGLHHQNFTTQIYQAKVI